MPSRRGLSFRTFSAWFRLMVSQLKLVNRSTSGGGRMRQELVLRAQLNASRIFGLHGTASGLKEGAVCALSELGDSTGWMPKKYA